MCYICCLAKNICSKQYKYISCLIINFLVFIPASFVSKQVLVSKQCDNSVEMLVVVFKDTKNYAAWLL